MLNGRWSAGLFLPACLLLLPVSQSVGRSVGRSASKSISRSGGLSKLVRNAACQDGVLFVEAGGPGRQSRDCVLSEPRSCDGWSRDGVR